MNILAFSDPHADAKALRDVVHSANTGEQAIDVVVGAGDFADRGQGTAEMLTILESLNCPLILVSGNHDRLEEMRDFVDTRPRMHLLHGNTVVIKGFVFVGIGSAIARAEPSRNSEWLHEEDAEHMLAEHPRADVLISHTPPRGAVDIHPDGSSGGSVAIRNAIERLTPSLCLCGHVHNAHRMQHQLGPTLVHNLGPRGYVHMLAEAS
jgi:Icc-related predicted phosphoesterase